MDLKDIPRLMRSLLTQMAKEYPREDLTVIACTPDAAASKDWNRAARCSDT